VPSRKYPNQEEAEKKAKEIVVEAKQNATVFAEMARDNQTLSAPKGGTLDIIKKG